MDCSYNVHGMMVHGFTSTSYTCIHIHTRKSWRPRKNASLQTTSIISERVINFYGRICPATFADHLNVLHFRIPLVCILYYVLHIDHSDNDARACTKQLRVYCCLPNPFVLSIRLLYQCTQLKLIKMCNFFTVLYYNN